MYILTCLGTRICYLRTNPRWQPKKWQIIFSKILKIVHEHTFCSVQKLSDRYYLVQRHILSQNQSGDKFLICQLINHYGRFQNGRRLINTLLNIVHLMVIS